MSTSRHFETHYTDDDYVQWEGKWELLSGTAVAMTPSPIESHENVVTQLSYQIVDQIKKNNCDCRVYTNLDWKVSNDTVVRPDLMVVCGARAEKHLERAPSLAIEVLSPSTATTDRSYKYELYEREGVKHYLLVDSSTRTVDAFSLIDTSYRPIDLTQDGLALDDSCIVRIEQNGLFD
jgi:Uma2 family endonuclease